MLRKILTYAYLVLYALSIMWMAALVVMRADPSGYLNKAVLALGIISGVLLLFSLVGFPLRRRRFSLTMWVGMSIWSAFLIWFSWFSDGSPFIQHEVHSSDLNQLAAESHRFKVRATLSFSVLLLWFWSYMLFWRRERR
jgi:hypothetical protein